LQSELLLPGIPRYNQIVLMRQLPSRVLLYLLLAIAVFGAASCAVPLGPGYTIEKQEIRVQFLPSPQPRIRVEADYQLKNTGNQPLTEIELRLPGKRRFHRAEPQAKWDSDSVALIDSPANARYDLLKLPRSWPISARHTLHLSVEIEPSPAEESKLSFTSDAFFLPSQGWSPDLVPARGALATGGVPPKKWNLVVQVPEDFLVHVSGSDIKKSRGKGQLVVRAEQHIADKYPFVVAGRYAATQIASGNEQVNLWTRTSLEQNSLRHASDQLVKTLQAYDSVFGNRGKKQRSLWIVECPVVVGCFTRAPAANASLPDASAVSQNVESTSAEMISLDSVVVDISGGAPKIATAAAPSLAASWLGYGQNPGFYEQEPPLSALPAFAAASGREALDGPSSRTTAIRKALRAIPVNLPATGVPEERNVIRAKSFLFFYALQDRYGRQAFRNALQHMFYARQGGGFNLNDLIAAFGEETHQNVAEFVRLWMKHPGVPQEFRARYEKDEPLAPPTTISKETTP
jgi:hypothetical protein